MQSCSQLISTSARRRAFGLLLRRGESPSWRPHEGIAPSASGMSPSDGYYDIQGKGDDQNKPSSGAPSPVTPQDALREMGSRSWSRSLNNTLNILRSLITSLASWIMSCREVLPQFYAPSPSQAVQRCFLVLGTTLILCILISGIDILWTAAGKLHR